MVVILCFFVTAYFFEERERPRAEKIRADQKKGQCFLELIGLAWLATEKLADNMARTISDKMLVCVTPPNSLPGAWWGIFTSRSR